MHSLTFTVLGSTACPSDVATFVTCKAPYVVKTREAPPGTRDVHLHGPLGVPPGCSTWCSTWCSTGCGAGGKDNSETARVREGLMFQGTGQPVRDGVWVAQTLT